MVQYFDRKLAELPSTETRLSYISSLTSVLGTDVGLAATRIELPDFKYTYLAWLSVRLTDILGDYIGNSRLRMARSALSTEWEVVNQNRRLFPTDDASTGRLLHFVFGVLTPYARSNKSRSSNNQTSTESPRKSKPGRPVSPLSQKVSTSVPQSIEALFPNDFNKSDLRDLLIYLGVLGVESGRWELGEVTGKGAKPKSAFPAAYRALVSVKPSLMRQTEAPVWRKLFEIEYGVGLSDRLATYNESNASTAFHDYFALAKEWITQWKNS